ncbi:MAG: hypothetical protein O6918_06190 [Deltaproteobacteria bacterium]|nr:hypothetical protein [Deltaproteobacteria bacterium]
MTESMRMERKRNHWSQGDEAVICGIFVSILLHKRVRNMPYIIGTAGHIDHGKTSLIKALTGLDTDRLKEEKERGISIDLGFAPCLSV